MSTSESQLYARALYDALIGGAQKSLRAASDRLAVAHAEGVAPEQRVSEALPADAPREVRNILLTLAQAGKLDLLPGIVQSFEQFGQSNARPLIGEVVSAVELDSDQVTKITNDLRARYGERLELRFSVEPSLIGGLIIRIGDQVLDNSLRTRLSAVQRNMLAG